MTKQTITLFLILSLLSSILSVALTSSEQINQSFGEKTNDSKPKKIKSDSKPKKEDKPKEDKAKPKEEDKPKDDTKSKEEDTKSNDDDKTRQ